MNPNDQLPLEQKQHTKYLDSLMYVHDTTMEMEKEYYDGEDMMDLDHSQEFLGGPPPSSSMGPNTMEEDCCNLIASPTAIIPAEDNQQSERTRRQCPLQSYSLCTAREEWMKSNDSQRSKGGNNTNHATRYNHHIIASSSTKSNAASSPTSSPTAIHHRTTMKYITHWEKMEQMMNVSRTPPLVSKRKRVYTSLPPSVMVTPNSNPQAADYHYSAHGISCMMDCEEPHFIHSSQDLKNDAFVNADADADADATTSGHYVKETPPLEYIYVPSLQESTSPPLHRTTPRCPSFHPHGTSTLTSSVESQQAHGFPSHLPNMAPRYNNNTWTRMMDHQVQPENLDCIAWKDTSMLSSDQFMTTIDNTWKASQLAQCACRFNNSYHGTESLIFSSEDGSSVELDDEPDHLDGIKYLSAYI